MQPQGRHPEVVHARDAEAGGESTDDQRPAAVPAVPDGEHTGPDDQHGHQETEDGQRDVVVDLGAGDVEAEHRDEVHRPDAGAEGGCRVRSQLRRAEPVAASARTVQRRPRAAPIDAITYDSAGVSQP